MTPEEKAAQFLMNYCTALVAAGLDPGWMANIAAATSPVIIEYYLKGEQ